jgi:hypothetical protein
MTAERQHAEALGIPVYWVRLNERGDVYLAHYDERIAL